VPKSAINGRVGLTVKEILRDNPRIPYSKIPAESCHVPGYKTVEKYLRNSGYFRIKLTKKVLLNSQKNNIEKGPEFWDNTVWSDETMIRSRPNRNEVYHQVHYTTNRVNLPFNHQVHSGGVWGP
jgi:hypothetical protein